MLDMFWLEIADGCIFLAAVMEYRMLYMLDGQTGFAMTRLLCTCQCLRAASFDGLWAFNREEHCCAQVTIGLHAQTVLAIHGCKSLV